jgi:DNA-binding transcriptional ArsR family regulator
MQAVLKALAEPRRVAILELVASGEMRAGDIADQFDTTRPAISQHLRVLIDAGLLIERREGTHRLYSVRPEGFTELRAFLDSFWNQSLTKLKQAVEGNAKRSKRGRR